MISIEPENNSSQKPPRMRRAKRIIIAIRALCYARNRTRMTRIIRIFTENFNPCVSVSSARSVFHRISHPSAFINAETLRVLDSAPTYALQGIRVYAGSESYASRLGTHVCLPAYVYAPSRGATREARDSGRLHLRLIYSYRGANI